MNCKLNFYNPKAAKADGKPYTFTDRLIMLRSGLVHVEYVFSERYGNISFSATLRDGAKCCRFKKIGYSHPSYWKSIIISCTDEEENRAWREACGMANKRLHWMDGYMRKGACFYGPNAIKYDLKGQLCHITKWKIWKPNPKKTWCSKACNELVYISRLMNNPISDFRVQKLFEQRAEMLPSQRRLGGKGKSQLYELCLEYFGPCLRDRL